MKKKREKEEKQKKHKKAKRSEDDDINNDTLDFDFFMNGIKAWAGQTPRKQFINSTYKLTDEDLIYLMEALSMKSHAIAKQDALDFVADRTEHDGTEGSDFIMCLINSSERVLEDGGVVGDSDMVGGYHWIIAFLKRVKKKISMKLFDVLSSCALEIKLSRQQKFQQKKRWKLWMLNVKLRSEGTPIVLAGTFVPIGNLFRKAARLLIGSRTTGLAVTLDYTLFSKPKICPINKSF